MTTPHEPPTARSTLLRGQSLPIEVPPGACLHVQQGHVRVHAAPQWLGARLLMPQHELREGAVQRFEDGGWLLVDAVSASSLLWRWPAARPSLWQRAGRVVAGQLRRARISWRPTLR